MYETIGTRIPKDLVRDIAYLSTEENTDKSKIVRDLLIVAIKARIVDLAIKKYYEKKISIGRAAELAKLPLVDFMKIAADRKISMNYSVVSLEEDFKRVLIKK